MSKLFVFRVQFDMVVQADDEGQAELLAEEEAVHQIDDGFHVRFIREAKTLADLPGSWGNLIPCGDEDEDEDRTCAEILERTE